MVLGTVLKLGKASFPHEQCHLRATLVGGFLLLSSFINVGYNQLASRIVTLTFPNEKCEQRIRVVSSQGTPTPSFPP